MAGASEAINGMKQLSRTLHRSSNFAFSTQSVRTSTRIMRRKDEKGLKAKRMIHPSLGLSACAQGAASAPAVSWELALPCPALVPNLASSSIHGTQKVAKVTVGT